MHAKPQLVSDNCCMNFTFFNLNHQISRLITEGIDKLFKVSKPNPIPAIPLIRLGEFLYGRPHFQFSDSKSSRIVLR